MKHSSVYASGIIIGKLIGFIMIPVYTRYLVPSDYGTLELLSLTIDFISIIIGAGVANAMFRYYYKYNDIKNKKEVISTGFILIATIFIISSIPLFLISPALSQLIFNSFEYTYYLRLMFIIMVFTAGFEIPMAYLRIQQRSVAFVSINLVRLLMMLSLNIYFLVVLGYGLVGVLYSSIITTVITTTYLSITTLKDIGLRFSLPKAKEIVAYGFPIIFGLLSAFVIRFSDRFFLQYFHGLEEVGIYSLGYKFGFILTMLVITPFDSIWAAQKFEIANQDNAQRIFSRFFTLFNVVLLTMGGLICVLIQEVVMVLSASSYWEAYKVVPLIVLSNIFFGWFVFTNIGIHIRYKTKYFAYVGLLIIALDLLLNYMLVPIIGMYGAALSVALVFFIRFILIYAISNRLYHISYEWIKILLYFIAIAVAVLIISNIHTPWAILTLLAKGMAFLFVSVIATLIIITGAQERGFIIELIREPSLWRSQLERFKQA